MRVEEIAVSECSNGDILASDVFNAGGVTLVVKDTVMNEYIKQRLIDFGVVNIRIYKSSLGFENSRIPYEEFRKGYKDTILHTKDMIHDLTTGKPLDYKRVSCISNQIHKNINENDNIIKLLIEVRNSDEYTYTHCVNTAFYSMMIAKWLNMADWEINKAIQSGLLHDIGKSRIPNEILCKGGILTKEEYEIIKEHTILGYGMVEGTDDIDRDVKTVVLFHHERIDGSGYPFNIGMDSINLYSRIVAVADVFDAMTSDRVYKSRVTPLEAFEMFQTVGLGIFDTKVLSVFLNNLAAYLVGSKVLLSNGEIGEIVYIPLKNLACPTVKISSGYLDLSKEKEIRIVNMI